MSRMKALWSALHPQVVMMLIPVKTDFSPQSHSRAVYAGCHW
jgi:hypothetical protein